MRRVLIVGSNGQDGQLLFEHRARSCAVVGLDLGSVRAHEVDPASLPAAVALDIRAQVDDLLRVFPPDELYYLAAHHHSSEMRPDDAAELRDCAGINFLSLVHFLDALRVRAPACRVFYAGSSHMFGDPTSPIQDESTPFAPRNPYAITKVAGANACALFRARSGIHASVGILYNHESPLRGPNFVSQRIARGARRAATDPTFRLRLGSLSAVVDWGYAPDYVDAMVRIVSQPAPDDYIIATGEPHTVRDFVHAAFSAAGLDGPLRVDEDGSLASSPSAGRLVGDASKLRGRTGWKPTVTFEEMVQKLVAAAR